MSVDVVHNLDSKLQEIRSALHNAGIYVSIPWLMWWAAKASTLNSESALFQLICQDFTRAYTFPLFESTSDETCSHGLFQCLAVVDLSISPFQRNQTNGSGASDELLPNYSSRRGSNFKAILHNGFENVVCIDMTNAHGSALRLRELGPGMKVLLCNFKRYGSFVLMNEHTTMRQFDVPQFQGIHAPSHDASLWSEHKSEANSHPGRPQEHAHTRTVTGRLVCLDSVVPYDSTQLQHHFVLIAWLKNSENDENIKVFFTSDVIASYIVKSSRHGRTEQRSGIECLAKDDICRMLSELGTRTFTLVNQIPSLDAQMVVEIEEPRVK